MPRSKRKARSQKQPRRVAVPKQMLLPLPGDYVRELSLAGHLTLAACCNGDGTRHLLFEMVRVTYMSFFMWKAGYGAADYQFYCDAEKALDQLACRAEQGPGWELDDEAVGTLERVMQIYDDQIGSVSCKAFTECKSKLDRLIRVRIPAKYPDESAN